MLACVAIAKVSRASSDEETLWKGPGAVLFAPCQLLPCGTGGYAVVYALHWQQCSTAPSRPNSYCFWLLLLAGDVAINPGPVRYPCTVFAKPVLANQQGVMCNTCDLWTHARYCGISRGESDAMSLQGDSCAWECPKCTISKCTISTLPFANTSFIIITSFIIDSFMITHERKPFSLICLSETC